MAQKPANLRRATVLADRRTEIDAAARAGAAPYRKQFLTEMTSRSVDDAARTVRFIITTNAVDRENDVIDSKGWDVGDYVKNPVVLWAHDYSQLPIARALEITPTATGLASTAQFPPKGVHPFADTVFELIKGGFLNACSVGFRPVDYSMDQERGGMNFQRQSLLEWSVVPVPANAEALTTAAAKGVDVTPVVAWAKSVMKQTGARILSAKRVQGLARAKTALDSSGQQTDPALAAKLAALDSHIDAADDIVDSIMVLLGIPDDDETPAPENELDMEAAVGAGLTSAARKTPEPTEGTADHLDMNDVPLCPQCGIPLPENMICPHCSGAIPMAASLPGSAIALRSLALPKVIKNGQSFHQHAEDDPIRWNRQLSKAFDVAGEPLEAALLEYAWASRYLEVPVQALGEETTFVPSARMGSFLASLEETVAGFKQDALRNMTDNGREVPPVYESLQLNSTTNRNFLVEGIRFLRREADDVRMAVKMTPSWSGIYMTAYYRREQAEVATKFVTQTWTRAAQLNYLKGEAFTLSGEFLDRGDLDWPDIFLEPAHEKVLRRIVDRINEQGGDMESRGLMIMGPPGTGKTLGARVMMRQADTTFIWVSARDFFRQGAYDAFTYAFDIAAECAPSILCFEDVDNWMGGSYIDLLKTEMDGMRRRKGIQTIMTTNFPELVPDALIDRPGRFDELMEIDLPTEEVRGRMLRAWLPEAPEASIVAAAAATAGYSGAHIRELTKYARTLAAEDASGFDVALVKALDKIKEQRELVAALRQGPDYRPGRQVRMLVGATKEYVAKRGRVLSAANESRLRTAQDNIAAAAGHMDAVLLQLESADPDDTEVMALELDDETVVVFGDEPLAEFDAVEIRAAVVQELRASLGPAIREQTRVALNRARGRVD